MSCLNSYYRHRFNQAIIQKYTLMFLYAIDNEPVTSMVHLEAMMFLGGKAIPELGRALEEEETEFTNLIPGGPPFRVDPSNQKGI